MFDEKMEISISREELLKIFQPIKVEESVFTVGTREWFKEEEKK